MFIYENLLFAAGTTTFSYFICYVEGEKLFARSEFRKGLSPDMVGVFRERDLTTSLPNVATAEKFISQFSDSISPSKTTSPVPLCCGSYCSSPASECSGAVCDYDCSSIILI